MCRTAFQLENMHSLDSSREADNGEEEAICVEVFEHALNRLAVDAERDTGSAEIQTTAHHVVGAEQVLIGGADRPSNAACTSANTRQQSRSHESENVAEREQLS